MPRWKRTLGDLPADAPRLLLVRFQRRGCEQVAQDEVLAGDYVLAGENHGKPVFQKQRKDSGDDSPDVLMYFWQSGYDEGGQSDGGTDDPGCWWMGQKVGGEAVWARHGMSSRTPPERDWRVVEGGDPSLELVVREAPEPKQEPAQPARPGGELPWDPPRPWRAISHDGGFYYWNDDTGMSVWEPPPGSRPPKVQPTSTASSGQGGGGLPETPRREHREPLKSVGRDTRREERRDERRGDAKPSQPSRPKQSLPRTRSQRAKELRSRLAAVAVPPRARRGKRSERSPLAAPAPRSTPASGVVILPAFVDSRRAATTRRSRSPRAGRSGRSASPPRLREAKREPSNRSSRSASPRCSRPRSRGRRPALELRPRDGSWPRSRSRSRSRSRWNRRSDDGDGAWNNHGNSWSKDAAQWKEWKLPDGPAKGPDAPQWSQPRTRAPLGRQVHLPSVVGSDEGLRKWLREEANDHLEQFTGQSLECIDVSGNNLTDHGANMLARFLVERRLPTQRLMLFKNRLENPSDICQLIEDPDCGVGSREGLAELHLSHNYVTSAFLGNVLTSVAKRIRETGKLRRPMWLRVERNGDLKSDAEAGRKLERPGLQICFEARCKESGCTLRHCKMGADVHVVFAMGKR